MTETPRLPSSAGNPAVKEKGTPPNSVGGQQGRRGRTPRGWAKQLSYARAYRKKFNMTEAEWRCFLDKCNARVKRRRLRLRRSGLNTNGQPYKHANNRRRFSLEQV